MIRFKTFLQQWIFAWLITSSSLMAAEKTNIVVMLGDSTTLCSRNSADAKLTEIVRAYLTQTKHIHATIINSGIGGDTAKGGYARLHKAVLAHNPDVVTIAFGLNDTGTYTPGEHLEWMEKIILAIRQKSKARILLVTSTPFDNKRHSWGKQFIEKGGLDEYMNANICMNTRTLATKYNLPVCDLHQYFIDKFNRKPGLIDKLLLPDGVHLSNEGNKVAAEYLAPMLATLLKNAANQAGN